MRRQPHLDQPGGVDRPYPRRCPYPATHWAEEYHDSHSRADVWATLPYLPLYRLSVHDSKPVQRKDWGEVQRHTVRPAAAGGEVELMDVVDVKWVKVVDQASLAALREDLEARNKTGDQEGPVLGLVDPMGCGHWGRQGV